MARLFHRNSARKPASSDAGGIAAVFILKNWYHTHYAKHRLQQKLRLSDSLPYGMVPQYRKSVLRGGVAQSLRELLESICAERKYEILSLEIQPDHLHLFVSFPPSVSIADAVRVLKGASARMLLMRHPELKNELWAGHLWSPSYYVGTAGSVSAETIKSYIERTEHIHGRR